MSLARMTLPLLATITCLWFFFNLGTGSMTFLPFMLPCQLVSLCRSGLGGHTVGYSSMLNIENTISWQTARFSGSDNPSTPSSIMFPEY